MGLKGRGKSSIDPGSPGGRRSRRRRSRPESGAAGVQALRAPWSLNGRSVGDRASGKRSLICLPRWGCYSPTSPGAALVSKTVSDVSLERNFRLLSRGSLTGPQTRSSSRCVHRPLGGGRRVGRTGRRGVGGGRAQIGARGVASFAAPAGWGRPLTRTTGAARGVTGPRGGWAGGLPAEAASLCPRRYGKGGERRWKKTTTTTKGCDRLTLNWGKVFFKLYHEVVKA